MYRSFSDRKLDPQTITRILDSATRGPSAGFTQGFDFLVLTEKEALDRFWSLATTQNWRESTTTHHGLWNAPMVVLPLANSSAYTKRYSETDKQYSNLDSLGEWPAPYWLIDSAFATMLILTSVVNENLGALFFGLFRNMDQIKKTFSIPEHYLPIGAVAIGYPDSRQTSMSSSRGRRDSSSQFHYNKF